MDAQRESGMINNRVFEAMSVGAPLISDHFPALEALCGDKVFYVKGPGDVARHIESLLADSINVAGGNEAAIATKAIGGRQRRRNFVVEGHTWARRVDQILPFVASLSNSDDEGLVDLTMQRRRSRTSARRCSRRGCLTLAIVIDPELWDGLTLGSTFVPAVDLLKSVYRIDWWKPPAGGGTSWTRIDEEVVHGWHHAGQHNDTGQLGKGSQEWRDSQQAENVGYLKEYDIVWAVGRWRGPADRAVRHELAMGLVGRRVPTPRLGDQLRGFVMWGDACTSSTESSVLRRGYEGRRELCPDFEEAAGLRWYDVVYCQTDWDHAFLKQHAFRAGDVSDNLQQAWGFGGANVDDGVAETLDGASDPFKNRYPSRGYDVLVVGTDNQVPEMLAQVNEPGLAGVALAVLVSSGWPALAARHDLLSMLAAAGTINSTDVGATTLDIDHLPPKLSLYVVETGDTVTTSPIPADVFLIQRSDNAVTLAETAFIAHKVVVVAEGEQGTWATLVTTTARGHYGRREDVQLVSGTSTRARALAGQRPTAWDTEFYSRRLVAGITRAFCLGRGNSRIAMVQPTEGSSRVIAVNDTILVEVLVEEFDLGRDGQWCVTAGGRTLLCVLRHHLTVAVDVVSSATHDDHDKHSPWPIAAIDIDGDELRGGNKNMGDGDSNTGKLNMHGERGNYLRVELGVELRSNIYRDVLYRSEYATLFIVRKGSIYTTQQQRQAKNDTFKVCERDHVADGCSSTLKNSGGASGDGEPGVKDAPEEEVYRASLDITDFFFYGDIV